MGTGGKERCLLQPPARLGSGQHSVAAALLFIGPETRTSLPEEQASGISLRGRPCTSWGRGRGQRCSCHISATHPVPVLARSCILSPSPTGYLPSCQAQPTLHRAIPRSSLVFPHLPASPCSPLSGVNLVTFWAGRNVTALWTLPLSHPRPVWHAARIRARPQKPQARLGRMPCACGPFGDMWGSGSSGVLTMAILPAEDSQQPALPSHLGPVLDSLGQSPHLTPHTS